MAVVEALVDAGADVNAANVRSLDTLVILHGQCCRMCLPQQGGWVGAWCVDTRCSTCVGWLCCGALGRRMAGLPSCPLVEVGTWQWWQRWCRGAPMCQRERYVEGSE